MKSPLTYQLIENSGGEIAIFNCLSYLFDREEMPLEFIKIMSSYSLGCYDEFGLPNNAEFCDNLLFFASSWINDYAEDRHIPLTAKYLTDFEVNLLEIRKCLLAGGCVDLKTQFEGKRYITITNMDDEFIYVFDPFYKTSSSFNPKLGVEVVLDKPFNYNRKIKIEQFISEKPSEYSLGIEKYREAVMFYRTDLVKEREFVD